MPTLNQIIYNIRNSKKGGILSDDDKITDRQLAFIVGYYRAMLIKRDMDKGRKPSYANMQSLGCVPMTQVDKSECCEITTDCIISRTVNPLPTPIDINNGVLLSFIGSADGDESFQFVSFARSRWAKHSKYTSWLRKAFLKNGHLYVTNDKVIEAVRTDGLFERPEEAGKYQKSCSDSSPCFTYDSPYPIELSMVPIITELIFKNEMMLLTISPQDTKNDADDRKQEPIQS